MQKYMLISFGLQAFSKFATVTALKLLFLLNHPDVHFKISIFDGQKFSFISEQSIIIGLKSDECIKMSLCRIFS